MIFEMEFHHLCDVFKSRLETDDQEITSLLDYDKYIIHAVLYVRAFYLAIQI